MQDFGKLVWFFLLLVTVSCARTESKSYPLQVEADGGVDKGGVQRLLSTSQGAIVWESSAQIIKNSKSQYFQISGRQLSRLNAQGGQLWTKDIGVPKLFSNYQTYCFSSTGLMIAAFSQTLEARSIESGEIVWTSPRSTSAEAHCAEANDLIIDPAANQNEFNAVAMQDGSTVWTKTLAASGNVPSFTNDDFGLNFTFFESPELTNWQTLVIDPANGVMKAAYQCADARYLPLLSRHLVVCVNAEGAVSGLSREDGHVLWTKAGSGAQAYPVVTEDGSVLLQVDSPSEGSLELLSKESGSSLWRFEHEGAYPQVASLTKKGILLQWTANFDASKVERSLLLNVCDGKIIWDKPFAIEERNAEYYHWERTGLVERLDPESASILWTKDLGISLVGLIDSAVGEIYAAAGSYPNQGLIALQKSDGVTLWESPRTMPLETTRGGLSVSVESIADQVYIQHGRGLTVLKRGSDLVSR